MNGPNHIPTIKDYRRAVRQAAVVRVQVRFGACEQWVRISKSEALKLVEGLDENLTEKDLEVDNLYEWCELGTATVYVG